MRGMTLKKVLLNEYGTFADRRIKDLNKGKSFIADDRKSSDHGADRQLFDYFCMIFADVEADDLVEVRLIGNVPTSTAVRGWIKRHGAKYAGEHVKVLTFEVREGEQEKLNELAQSVAAIVAPEAPRYPVPSYKYVCPRTAKSLKRLAKALEKAWTKKVD